MGHGAKAGDYLDWKTGLLGNIKHSVRENDKGARFVDFTPLPELASCAGGLSRRRQEVPLRGLSEGAHPLALAIWYMDDGSFTVRSKGLQQRTQEAAAASRSVSKP
jgi:recombination protein RecA